MAAVANIENLDRRKDTGFGLACRAVLSRFILVLAYCIVVCALLSVILDVDFFEFVNSIFCRCTRLFVDWGFYVISGLSLKAKLVLTKRLNMYGIN